MSELMGVEQTSFRPRSPENRACSEGTAGHPLPTPALASLSQVERTIRYVEVERGDIEIPYGTRLDGTCAVVSR